MHVLLTKLLAKRGVKREDLDTEEKKWFEEKELILDQDEISIPIFKKFIEVQIGEIERQFQNLDNDIRKNERLIIAHTLYKKLLQTIGAPKVERKMLEEYLINLIK